MGRQFVLNPNLICISFFAESLSLDGNVLTGMIPSELGLLTSIQELKLHDNEIYGTIPDEFGNLLEIGKCCQSPNVFQHL